MKILAFETAVGPPGLCLYLAPKTVLNWQGSLRPDPKTLLAAAENLLKQAGFEARDLDVIACGRGPGAFTGVRLGIALAQGFALGTGCPVVAISELRALAFKAHHQRGWDRVVTLLDARQGEIYQAAYDCTGGTNHGDSWPREALTECLVKPEAVCIPEGEWTLAGPGAGLIETGGRLFDVDLLPDAEAVARLAERDFALDGGRAATAIEPVYLRERVATPKSRRLRP